MDSPPGLLPWPSSTSAPSGACTVSAAVGMYCHLDLHSHLGLQREAGNWPLPCPLGSITLATTGPRHSTVCQSPPHRWVRAERAKGTEDKLSVQTSNVLTLCGQKQQIPGKESGPLPSVKPPGLESRGPPGEWPRHHAAPCPAHLLLASPTPQFLRVKNLLGTSSLRIPETDPEGEARPLAK